MVNLDRAISIAISTYPNNSTLFKLDKEGRKLTAEYMAKCTRRHLFIEQNSPVYIHDMSDGYVEYLKECNLDERWNDLTEDSFKLFDKLTSLDGVKSVELSDDCNRHTAMMFRMYQRLFTSLQISDDDERIYVGELIKYLYAASIATQAAPQPETEALNYDEIHEIILPASVVLNAIHLISYDQIFTAIASEVMKHKWINPYMAGANVEEFYHCEYEGDIRSTYVNNEENIQNYIKEEQNNDR